MKARKRPSWDEYALMLAMDAAERSEDPYVQVGACAIRKDRSIASLGYNGPPSGIDIDWSDRDARRQRVIHAEANCLGYVRPGECNTIAVTLLPCNACLTLIARYGIKRIIYRDVYDKDDTTLKLAKEFGIELVQMNITKEANPTFAKVRWYHRLWKSIKNFLLGCKL